MRGIPSLPLSKRKNPPEKKAAYLQLELVIFRRADADTGQDQDHLRQRIQPLLGRTLRVQVGRLFGKENLATQCNACGPFEYVTSRKKF